MRRNCRRYPSYSQLPARCLGDPGNSRPTSVLRLARALPQCGRAISLLHRHEDAVADLAFDGLRQVALAGGVLDQDYLAGTDDPRLAVARGDLHPGVEIDDVLPARRRVPVEIVIGLHLAENDAGRGQPLR